MDARDIEEEEKNIDYLWNQSHNLYNFRINDMSFKEFIEHRDELKRQGDLYTLEQIDHNFFVLFAMALREDESLKALMKANFNTVKAKMKSAMYKSKLDLISKKLPAEKTAIEVKPTSTEEYKPEVE